MTQTYGKETRTMSPLKVEILLWYYSRVGDYRDGDFTAPAVREALELFKTMGLLRPRNNSLDKIKQGSYVLTDGGLLLVERLLSTPFPELKWSY